MGGGYIGFGLADLRNLIDYLISNMSFESGIDSGTATGGGASTMTDTAKNWEVNSLAGAVVKITAGTGIGQFRTIVSNTANQITVTAPWGVVPIAGSEYLIVSLGGGGVPTGVYGSVYETDFVVGGALQVDLDTTENGPRNVIVIDLLSSIDCSWYISTSVDGITYSPVDEVEVLAGVGEHCPYDSNAHRYIRAEVFAAGNHTCTIAASR